MEKEATHILYELPKDPLSSRYFTPFLNYSLYLDIINKSKYYTLMLYLLLR